MKTKKRAFVAARLHDNRGRVMRLLRWPVHGIRAVAKKGFMDSFSTFDADVVCLQETKAMPDQVPKEIKNIPGYISYYHSAERKGYSGTAVYTRRPPISVEYGLGDERFDNEGRTICLQFDGFYLYNIYFPNGGQGPERLKYKLDFYTCFLEKIKTHFEKEEHVIVCGDVNTAHKEIDLSNPKANSKVSGFLPEEREYIDRFLQAGLVDTYRTLYPDRTEEYTWWSYKTFARDRNVGWRIDYFLTDEMLAERVLDTGMLSNVMGSDHCPIYLDLQEQ